MSSNRLHVIKVAVSLLLIIISLWALFLPPLFPSSTRALVNASTYRVTAPIAGKVNAILIDDRQPLEANAPIITLQRDQAKTMEDIALLKLDIAQTQLELDAIRIALAEQDIETEKRASSALSKAQYGLWHAYKKRNDTRAALAIAKESEAKITELHDQNVVTFADLQQARAATLDAQNRLSDFDKEVDSLKREIKNLEDSKGPTQQPSYDYQDSQAKSLALRAVAIDAEIQASTQRLAQLNELMDSGAELAVTANHSGILWQAYVVENQTISRGDALFSVAQNSDLFVEAYLARLFLDSVAIGDNAVIYLNDDQSFHQGTITSIQAQEQDDSIHYAIPSVAPNVSTLKLTIAIQNNTIDVSQLGRLSKVLITSAKPSIAERILVRLSLALRTSN